MFWTFLSLEHSYNLRSPFWNRHLNVDLWSGWWYTILFIDNTVTPYQLCDLYRIAKKRKVNHQKESGVTLFDHSSNHSSHLLIPNILTPCINGSFAITAINVNSKLIHTIANSQLVESAAIINIAIGTTVKNFLARVYWRLSSICSQNVNLENCWWSSTKGEPLIQWNSKNEMVVCIIFIYVQAYKPSMPIPAMITLKKNISSM